MVDFVRSPAHAAFASWVHLVWPTFIYGPPCNLMFAQYLAHSLTEFSLSPCRIISSFVL